MKYRSVELSFMFCRFFWQLVGFFQNLNYFYEKWAIIILNMLLYATVGNWEENSSEKKEK